MRYGIFSDIHANLEAFTAVMNAYREESIDKYLCVGDVVGYGANPAECINILQGITEVSVAGNHDWAAAGVFSLEYFNPNARKAIEWTSLCLVTLQKDFLKDLKPVYKNDNLILVHGTLDSPEEFNYVEDSGSAEESFELLDTPVCFVGHSHKMGVFIKGKGGDIEYLTPPEIKLDANNKYIVNVGSVGQPRDSDCRAAYCIYDSSRQSIQLKRINYDIRNARRKIIDAGLPKFLGDRLLSGK